MGNLLPSLGRRPLPMLEMPKLGGKATGIELGSILWLPGNPGAGFYGANGQVLNLTPDDAAKFPFTGVSSGQSFTEKAAPAGTTNQFNGFAGGAASTDGVVRLFAAFANNNTQSNTLKYSEDLGATWKDPTGISTTGGAYYPAFFKGVFYAQPSSIFRSFDGKTFAQLPQVSGSTVYGSPTLVCDTACLFWSGYYPNTGGSPSFVTFDNVTYTPISAPLLPQYFSPGYQHNSMVRVGSTYYIGGKFANGGSAPARVYKTTDFQTFTVAWTGDANTDIQGMATDGKTIIFNYTNGGPGLSYTQDGFATVNIVGKPGNIGTVGSTGFVNGVFYAIGSNNSNGFGVVLLSADGVLWYAQTGGFAAANRGLFYSTVAAGYALFSGVTFQYGGPFLFTPGPGVQFTMPNFSPQVRRNGGLVYPYMKVT